jgi:HSP20 family molecular chaperone IbpA
LERKPVYKPQTTTTIAFDSNMSFLIDDLFTSGLHSPAPTIRRPRQNNSLSQSPFPPLTSDPSVLDTVSVMEMDEDESCLRLTLDMPGVRGKDISVTVQRGVLSVRGYRCIQSMDGRTLKKQKLCRRFAVDTDVVDVSRAHANIWNGVLVLYANKKSKPVTVTIPVTEKPEFEYFTPGATAPVATTIDQSEDEQHHT